jgi:subfamily B ATP-binding cassette protein MsbA
MKQVKRLLSYGRRYWARLSASVILMAVAGAANAAMLLLIKQVFDRVLVTQPKAGPIPLLPRPIFGLQIDLARIIPLEHRGILAIVAVAIVAVFFIKGVCDYIGNYLVSYAGYSSVTDLRNAVFDKVLKQGAEFFEAHSTGQLMSSIMNDVDKVQVATSQILADLLRQSFAALAAIFVLVSIDPQLPCCW